jgi:3-deoxy-7-phosphoheptulonate synthase
MRVAAVAEQSLSASLKGAAEWGPTSWRSRPVQQQPNYPDPAAVQKACGEIATMPPLIFAGECRTLQDRLAKAAKGDAFILQGGDCAEAFTQFNANNIRDLYRVILQMSVVLQFGGGVPVVKLGRIAGQFAKPRSADTEKVNGVELPSYRGDIINGPEFTSEARVPDPFRLVKAYNQSAATLNLLRGFSYGGYGGLSRVSQWNMDFMSNSPEVRLGAGLEARWVGGFSEIAVCTLLSSCGQARQPSASAGNSRRGRRPSRVGATFAVVHARACWRARRRTPMQLVPVANLICPVAAGQGLPGPGQARG